MTTPEAAYAGPVPPMTIDLEGSSYGGQYWSCRDYRVQFSAKDDGITIHAEASDGSPVDHREYDRATTELLALPIWAQPGPEPVNAPGVVGLSRALHLHLGSDMGDVVDLHNHLEQIGEWLKYALGLRTWDPANRSWEY